MKRKHKKYSKPKRPFDKARIEEEAQIKKEFGLKNKKEIWKADARIGSMRETAKKLITASEKEKEVFLKKLQKIGLDVASLADVLSLDKRDYLNRRLQTIVHKKKLVPTIKTARQMIVHKKVSVDNKIVNKPSYIVPVELESKIKLKQSKKKIEDLEKDVKKEVEAIKAEAKASEEPEPKAEAKETEEKE